MDPANRGFMNLLNQGSSSQHSGSSRKDFPPQIPSTFPQAHPTHSSQSLSPNFHNFHPFGLPANYQLYGNSPPGFHGFQQQGNWLQSTPINFQGFRPQGFQQQESWGYSPTQAVGCASSHGSESASPCPTTSEEKNFVSVEDSSGGEEEKRIEEAGGREEGGRRGVRLNWTEDENIRLLSAWVNNSVDPIDGNDKKLEHYWKAVAAEFNSNTPSNRKRTVVQCKSHWKGVKKEVTKFCGVYSQVTRTWRSGESDDMILQRAHAWFKSQNSEKPFTLEYMWKELKKLPKWQRIIEEDNNNKRTKISESGAYTSSSNQDTEEESRHLLWGSAISRLCSL
jgi:hypothetical protein